MLKKIKFSYSWVLADELMVGSAPLEMDNLIELEILYITSFLQ